MLARDGLLRRAARFALRKVRGAPAAQGARVPALKRAVGAVRLTPTVWFLCPDYDVPSGGIRTLYRHVDLLNDAGISAAILHAREGFACTWFPHRTRIQHAPTTWLGLKDVLVVPEVYGASIRELPAGVPQVIFNQGAYLTFAGTSLTEGVEPSPYLGNPDLRAVLVVSEDSARYLRHAFPQTRVERVRLSVDPTLFHPRGRTARRSIALMPRRNREDALQVVQLLRSRGRLRGWELELIDGLSQAQVAEALRRSAFFLSLGHQEGLGLPPLEAMACGCLVVGFPARGGREFLLPEWSLPVEQGDVVAAAQALEDALARHDAQPEWFADTTRRAVEFVQREYSPERERADVVGFFRELLAKDLRRGLSMKRLIVRAVGHVARGVYPLREQSELARRLHARLVRHFSYSHKPVPVTHDGIRFDVLLGDNLQRHLFFCGSYEPELHALLMAELREGGVLVDVGANIGVHCLPVARMLRDGTAGRVHAFEAAPDTAERLRRMAEANGVSAQLDVVQVALGDKPGTAHLRSSREGGAHDVGMRSLYGTGDDAVAVEVTTFDAWAQAVRLERWDVLKVDVEGAEMDVLRGMQGTLRRLRPRLLIVEVLDAFLQRAGSSREELLALMKSVGYAEVPATEQVRGLSVAALAPNLLFRPVAP